MRRYALITLLLLAIGSGHASGQEFSLSTNAFDYAYGGTLNISASWGPSRHWTIEAGAKYNPFSKGSYESEYFSKQRLLKAGARWWPWHIYSGWWLSGAAMVQEYSKAPKGNPETAEGERYGASLGGGYSKMLGRHFNLDFGFGLWGGYETRTTYACQRCGKKISDGERFFVSPSEILIALSYIF